MTIEAARRGFVEKIFDVISNRWILLRHFHVTLDPITPEEILGIMAEFGLMEWREVDPASNDFGAPVLPTLIRTRPEEEIREERRARVRRAIERINRERRGGSAGQAPEK